MHWLSEVKRSRSVTKNVMVARLLVTCAATAVCCCCLRGSAFWYNCQCFSFFYLLKLKALSFTSVNWQSQNVIRDGAFTPVDAFLCRFPENVLNRWATWTPRVHKFLCCTTSRYVTSFHNVMNGGNQCGFSFNIKFIILLKMMNVGQNFMC